MARRVSQRLKLALTWRESGRRMAQDFVWLRSCEMSPPEERLERRRDSTVRLRSSSFPGHTAPLTSQSQELAAAGKEDTQGNTCSRVEGKLEESGRRRKSSKILPPPAFVTLAIDDAMTHRPRAQEEEEDESKVRACSMDGRATDVSKRRKSTKLERWIEQQCHSTTSGLAGSLFAAFFFCLVGGGGC